MEDASGIAPRAPVDLHAATLLVSCIVPVYNPGPYLHEALDSILAQQHRPLDIILVDDGSTVPLGEWNGVPLTEQARSPLGGELRLSVMRQDNGGPAAARNTGIAHSRGTLIAFLDQDDRWAADKLRRQVAYLRERPLVDVVVAHAESVWEHGAGRDIARAPDQPRSGVVPAYVSSTMLARREVFSRVGGFDPAYRYADSLDWFARARDAGVGIELMPDVLLYHRVHGGNLSRRGEASRAECARILKRALDRRRISEGTLA